MDKLKQYLQEHRWEMDVEIPPVDLLPHIQAGAVAAAAKAVLIKYVIGISISAVIGTSIWLITNNQRAGHTPPPVTPPKEVIQKDTVPVQKDTMPASPVIHPRKKKMSPTPPAPPVIHKHKISVDTIKHKPQPRIKKNVDTTTHLPQPRIKKNIDTVVHPTPPRIKKNLVPVDYPTKPHPKKKPPVPIT